MSTTTENKVLNIKECLEYKKESIVRKTFTEDRNTSITGFAFDRGQSILPCTASVNAAIHILEGRAEVMIAGENYDLDEGEMILMPKDKPHALFAKTKLKLALFKG
ncbi:MAG: cupin domain-containing protein [Cyanobacteria bacterium RUI128]|nr:cupin domain-containing protein [Cyanobacteria bacterium RUI128]